MKSTAIACMAAVGIVAMGLAAGGSQTATAEKAHIGIGEEITTAAQYDAKVIGADKPVLVEFYDTRCGTCQRLAPVLSELEKEYAGRIRFRGIDVDKAKALFRAHGVKITPTLLLYKDGKVVKRVVGYQSKDSLTRLLDSLLKAK